MHLSAKPAAERVTGKNFAAVQFAKRGIRGAQYVGERGFNHRVAGDRTLRFQRGDGGFESLPFVGHVEQDTNSTRAAVNAYLTISPWTNGCFRAEDWRASFLYFFRDNVEFEYRLREINRPYKVRLR